MEWFVSGFLLSLSLCMDIGMVNVAIIRAGLNRGLAPSLMVGLGSSFGDLTYALLSAVGMAALLQFAAVRWILWIGGSAVLVYLTWTMVRAALHPKEMDLRSGDAAPLTRMDRLRFFSDGYMLALSSPSAILWFATVGGSIIASQGAGDIRALLVFYVGFFCAGVVWSFGLAWVSSTSGQKLGMRFIRWVSWASAALFLYFAVRVFIDGLSLVR